MVMTARFARGDRAQGGEHAYLPRNAGWVHRGAKPYCHKAQSQERGNEVVAHNPLREAVQQGNLPGPGVQPEDYVSV